MFSNETSKLPELIDTEKKISDSCRHKSKTYAGSFLNINEWN
jgi:hypothetical protein